MYRIAVVAEQEREAFHYAEQIARFCGEKGMFPKIEPNDDPERFFDAVGRDAPTNAVIALSGVAGLNTAEHLRSLCPACRIIWWTPPPGRSLFCCERGRKRRWLTIMRT